MAAFRRFRGDRPIALEVVHPIAVPPDTATRRAALGRALTASSVVVAGGILVAGLPELVASAPSRAGDLEILNFALGLEYLQEAYYKEAAASPNVTGDLKQFIDVALRHEAAHVSYLTTLLGTKAAKAPTFDFGNTLATGESFAATAVMLEDLGVSAYNGQAANLTSARLADAAKIVSVDARHAAWIRSIVGQTPSDSPIDKPRTAKEVSAKLATTGFVR
jgi:hypothetical protein